MQSKVLDSWAMIAYLEGEPASERVVSLLFESQAGTARLMMTAVNWGEIYYMTMREISQEAAEEAAARIAQLPIEVVPIGADLRLVRQAAVYKATRRMSYADCFAAALARLEGAQLVTGDPEFAVVEDEVQVDWLPRS
jgi:predicted nucleic acid-binding protein